MAGKGSRFADAGFDVPKPLISVAGKPMFHWPVESVKKMIPIQDKDFIFILREEHVRDYAIDKAVSQYLPESTIIVGNDFHGAAQTVYLAKNYMDPEEELLQTDCDQYFICSQFAVARKRAVSEGLGGIIPVKDSDNSGYSYVELDEQNFVKRTAEKEQISRHAAIGVYYFTKSKYFLNAISQMMDQHLTIRGEYYMCPVYNFVIPQAKPVLIEADIWMTMGTPEEKTKFEKYISSRKK